MTKKVNTLQSVIDFLVDHGTSDFSANMFIHTNILALDGAGNTNIVDAAQNGDWDTIWAVIQLYVDGDLT